MSYRELWQSLLPSYDEREARAVVSWLLDVVFGWSQTDIVCGVLDRLQGSDLVRLQSMMNRLQDGEPVQYVAGMADFGSRQFHVAPGVLIPRPETFELCQWIARCAQSLCRPSSSLSVLDIGTGSGCIACTLARELPHSEVSAWDISEKALQIARKNAEMTGSIVQFRLQDALTPPHDTGRWDIIVSNPPYICEHERQQMERRVFDHEPSLALFVPDDDPLRFYRAIGSYALEALKPHGSLFFELNAAYASDAARLMEEIGFRHVDPHNDQYGRPRFLKVSHS